jgi:hypothetical protein
MFSILYLCTIHAYSTPQKAKHEASTHKETKETNTNKRQNKAACVI